MEEGEMSEAREDLAALEKVSFCLRSKRNFANRLRFSRTTRRSRSRPTTERRTWSTRRQSGEMRPTVMAT